MPYIITCWLLHSLGNEVLFLVTRIIVTSTWSSFADVEPNRTQNLFFNNAVMTYKGVQIRIKSNPTEGWTRILVHQRIMEPIRITFEVRPTACLTPSLSPPSLHPLHTPPPYSTALSPPRYFDVALFPQHTGRVQRHILLFNANLRSRE